MLYYILALLMVLMCLYIVFFRKQTVEKTIEISDAVEDFDTPYIHEESSNLADNRANILTGAETKDNVGFFPSTTESVHVPFTPLLTEGQVREIRAVINPDISTLARQYGVSTTTIRNVLNKKTYRNVV